MIVIYINGEGTAEKLSPSHIYQGSNQSGVLVFAPTPPQTPMGIAFRLPDGTSTPYYLMTYQGNYEGLSQYEFTLPTSITQLAGHAAIALQATYSDGQQNSQLIEFEIEESVVVVPPEPAPDVYTVLKQAIAKNSADISGIQGQINNIENLAESADKKSDNAIATANQAKTTADGLADSIAQANTTAQQAVDTADEAVEDIAQYKSETDGNIAQFKHDVNEEITQFENATDSKIEDFQNTVNGQVANIEATANAAVSTANEAKATADGLADSIAQADTTASEAKEIAEEALEQSKVTGTKVNIDGAFATEVNFDSDPQTQIDALKSTDTNLQGQIDNLGAADTALQNGKVNKSGDTMTGDLTAPTLISGGFKQRDTSKDYLDLIDGKGANFGLGGLAGNIYRLQQMLRTDPTKLEPTTANGWTVGDSHLTLPGAGVYLVSINGSDIGILIFHKVSPSILWATTSFVVPSPKTVGVCMVGRYLSYPSGVGLWQAAETNDNQPDVTSVAYKKLV